MVFANFFLSYSTKIYCRVADDEVGAGAGLAGRGSGASDGVLRSTEDGTKLSTAPLHTHASSIDVDRNVDLVITQVAMLHMQLNCKLSLAKELLLVHAYAFRHPPGHPFINQ
jgi:hypothetical protein